jgi:IclR family transcriptional regulator, KDG regulon repressor
VRRGRGLRCHELTGTAALADPATFDSTIYRRSTRDPGRSIAAPFLTQLRDLTRQTALLSVPGNGEPIVLSCVEYLDRLSISSRPGNHPPSHCSSQGRIALAFADEPARKRVLGRKLTAFTKHSITDRPLIEKRLGVIRERLFEDAMDEVQLGIGALSAPLFRDDEECVASTGSLARAVWP